MAGSAAACGGDDSTASSETTVASAAVSTAETAAQSTAASASDSTAATDSGGASGEVAAAQAIVDAAMEPPTKIALETPLDAKPESGKTFVYLDCGAGSCTYLGEQVRDAATTAGWKYEVIPFDISNPANLVAAMQQALEQFKPAAVSFASFPEPVWSSVKAQYAEAGAVLIPIAVGPVEIDDTVIYNVYDEEQSAKHGELLAHWFIADSGAQGNALIVNYPDLGSLTPQTTGITETIEASCSACKSTVLEATIEQVNSNGVTPAIVSALQRDPSITHVLSTESEFHQNLPSALDAAGISATFAGTHASNQNLADLESGDTAAFVGNPLPMMAWLAVDAALRHDQGMEQEPQELPRQILTKDNVGTLTDTSFSTVIPSDYKQQFTELWLLG